MQMLPRLKPCAGSSMLLRRRTRKIRAGGLIELVNKEYLWDPPPAPLLKDEKTGWTQGSKRVGVLARKVGMIHDWTEWLQLIPVTVLKVEPCYIIQQKQDPKNNFFALQVGGGGDKKLKRTTKPLLGHFEKANVPPQKILSEFRVTENALIPLGTLITARHFYAGQMIDVQGASKGKGFQGVMKKWGFKGMRATHGVSLTHRSAGATGMNQSPGRVFPGKKMAGRMGGGTVTMKNLLLWKINFNENLLYVKGSIPGPPGSVLRVIDAKNKKHTKFPPFPTFVAQEGAALPEVDEASLSPPYEIRNQQLHPRKDWGLGEFDPAKHEKWAHDVTKNADVHIKGLAEIVKEDYPKYAIAPDDAELIAQRDEAMRIVSKERKQAQKKARAERRQKQIEQSQKQREAKKKEADAAAANPPQ